MREGILRRKILVNCTAATSGGALTVLKQFIKSIEKYDSENLYYIFCTSPEISQYNCDNIKIINNIYRKKWIGRILWDSFGIENWLRKNRIEPDLIVSLQNTGVRLGRKVKQIVYYHQSLPMYDYDWSIKEKKERILWFYNKLYPWFVKRYFFHDDILVVQSEWMKTAGNQVLNIDLNKIKVIKPMLQENLYNNINIDFNYVNDAYQIIYPAADLVFKNHKILYEALKLISKERQDIINNLQFFTTLDYDKICKDEIKGLEKNIKFLGNIDFIDLLNLYNKMDLMVFPSYLETVGFPLLEAAFFGLPIIASDLPYARETTSGYEGARFVAYNDAVAWAREIIQAYDSKRKYPEFKPNKNDTWAEFFVLIREQLKRSNNYVS